MKKKLLAVALAGVTGAFASPVLAADPKAPEPDYSLSGNLGLFSDYRFRGMAQSKGGPALQGGFDLAHKTGGYAGVWSSTVSNWANANGNGQEIDLYLGFKTDLEPVVVDVGYIAYTYPGNTPAGEKQGTREVYVGMGLGPFSYKIYRTTGNWFGFCSNSSGSVYQDLSFGTAFTEKISFSAHAGKQNVKCSVDSDFKDYKIGLNFDLGDSFSMGVAYVSTGGLSSAGKPLFTQNGDGTGKELYKSGAVLSLTKTF